MGELSEIPFKNRTNTFGYQVQCSKDTKKNPVSGKNNDNVCIFSLLKQGKLHCCGLLFNKQ